MSPAEAFIGDQTASVLPAAGGEDDLIGAATEVSLQVVDQEVDTELAENDVSKKARPFPSLKRPGGHRG